MLSHSATILNHSLLYLDPGSGSILIQLLLAVILGAGITLKLSWKKIKSIFRRDQTIELTPDEEDNHD